MVKNILSNIGEIYSASTLVLSLTNEGEAFGLVPYEANLCGTPCIAPEFGAILEFIDDGKNGLLVNTRDVGAIVEKMDWALSHLDECANIVAAANETINEKLMPSVMVRNLANVYSSLVTRR